LPSRLEFYESWLNPAGLRDGRIGLAPLAAVLSFLRQESGDPFLRIAARAGEYSAKWLVDEMSPAARRLLMLLPHAPRLWLVMRLARRLVRQTYGGSRAIIRGAARGRGQIDLRGSVFCQVRERVPHPLCEYYVAALRHLLQRFELPHGAQATECRAAGASRCLIAGNPAPRKAAGLSGHVGDGGGRRHLPVWRDGGPGCTDGS
jgi:bacteriochlorophyll 4-vinyl reductase